MWRLASFTEHSARFRSTASRCIRLPLTNFRHTVPAGGAPGVRVPREEAVGCAGASMFTDCLRTACRSHAHLCVRRFHGRARAAGRGAGSGSLRPVAGRLFGSRGSAGGSGTLMPTTNWWLSPMRCVRSGSEMSDRSQIPRFRRPRHLSRDVGADIFVCFPRSNDTPSPG